MYIYRIQHQDVFCGDCGFITSQLSFFFPARSQNFDVVLVDTAGRMQDNAPLMTALAKLIAVNTPDLVLFVGEALVGNEAVDQLVCSALLLCVLQLKLNLIKFLIYSNTHDWCNY